MADSASFSSLLKSVLTDNSSVVKFQGQHETYQKGFVSSTEPKVAREQLEFKVESVNPSTNVSSLASGGLIVPNLECSHCEEIPELIVKQQNPDHANSPATDGYSWRKYGQKQMKSTKGSRSYYKCVHSNCYAKKKVQHCDFSSQVINTVYIGQHNHGVPQNKCSMSIASSSSSKLTATSDKVNSDHKVDGTDMTLHISESEQQCSSSFNGNIRSKVEEQNGNELESEKIYSSSKVGHLKKNSCLIADADVQVKHGVETGSRKRAKESNIHLVPVKRADPETKVVVHAAADGAMLSDGFRWRKYGQKLMKGNSYLRSYYRCTSAGCPSRKHVETATDDATAKTITYEGKHDHDMPVPKKPKGSKSPSHISRVAHLYDAHCKKINSSSSRGISSSTNPSVEKEGDMLAEKVMELGGEMALESAQTLLSIGIELRPC